MRKDKSHLIKTSDPDWLKKILAYYRDRQPFEFIDDGYGVSRDDLATGIALIKSAKEKLGMSWKEIAQILVGIGLSGMGLWLLIQAVKDSVATARLKSLLVTGFALLAMGSLFILKAFGQTWRVAVNIGNNALRVEPA